LVESSIATLKKSPWLVALYPFWLLQGKGYLKAQLIKHCDIDISTLPYNQTTIDYINKRKKAGNSGSESFSCISPISTSAFSIFSGSVVSSCCCL
jgi:hypothetical protein